MIKYAVIFWAIAGIITFALIKTNNIHLRILIVTMITCFGIVFTNIVIEDIIKPIQSSGKEEKEKNYIKLKFILLSILKMAGIFLLVIGVCSFINGLLSASGSTPWITEKTEIPLTTVGDYIMDNEGRLYCSLNFYCRIQQYDSSGNFLRGWFTDSGGGEICMKIDDKSQIIVANIKFHNIITFDSEGKIIKKEKLEGNEYEKWKKKDEKSENLLKILQSKIPLYIWFLFGPQSWLTGATGMIIFNFSDKKLEKLK